MAIPKDYAFYQAKADYWNQRLFACHKVAAFYLRPRDEMQSKSHPGHIQTLQLADKHKAEDQAKQRETAQAQARTQDLARLGKRKQARWVLERACRPGSAIKHSGPQPPQQVDHSLWERLDQLPVSQLKKFISTKQLELDRRNHHLGATETIKARTKTRPPSCVESRQELGRARLMQRHAQLTQLETRSGVRKHRQQQRTCTPTPFGTTRNYTTSGLFNRLSRSRDAYAQDSANDLRGLLHVDYPEVVNKLQGRCSEASQPLEPEDCEDREESEVELEQMRQWMQEMEDFEGREKLPSAGSQVAFLAMIQGR